MCPQEQFVGKICLKKFYLHLLPGLGFWERSFGEFARNPQEVVKTATRVTIGTISVITFFIIVSNFRIFSDSNWKKKFRQCDKNCIRRVQGINSSKTIFYGFFSLVFFDSERKIRTLRPKNIPLIVKNCLYFSMGDLRRLLFKNWKTFVFSRAFFSEFDASFIGVLVLPFRQR